MTKKTQRSPVLNYQPSISGSKQDIEREQSTKLRFKIEEEKPKMIKRGGFVPALHSLIFHHSLEFSENMPVTKKNKTKTKNLSCCIIILSYLVGIPMKNPRMCSIKWVEQHELSNSNPRRDRTLVGRLIGNKLCWNS